MGAWLHGESYMIGECVKIYKKISQEGHFEFYCLTLHLNIHYYRYA